ncbi:MAG: glycine--tRNA ligase subunit beta, partial [Alphaproteobacteria bacterium]
MRTHQKYFALETSDGALAPNFAVVANIESKDDGKRIVAGNERVLRARLADARFFWDQDRKVPLNDRLAALEKVVFHAKLGTLADRVRRMQALSRTMAKAVDGADAESADKAALLAKADLVSDMVGEFPELQGIMGRYYALEEGVKGDVADAIRDHYAPQGPADACTTQPISIAVALAEKLDTLAGFFAIDEKPTGSRDPYALRRAALGIIRLALKNQLPLPLRPAFIAAHAGYTGLTDAADADVTASALLQFFGDRLKAHLRGQGVPHHHITAVFALGDEDDLV